MLAVLLTLAVPGAGHAYLGRRAKGLLLFLAVGAPFLIGIGVAGCEVVSWARQPIWFVGQVFAGGLTGIALLCQDPHRPVEPSQLGLLYTCVAALLNFLCMLDAAGTAVRPDAPGGAAPPAAASAPGAA